VALLLLFVSTSVFAQVTASLSGTVSDSSGALIPGVEVTAKNIRTGITTTNLTNETGSFVLLSLQPGTYTLRSTKLPVSLVRFVVVIPVLMFLAVTSTPGINAPLESD